MTPRTRQRICAWCDTGISDQRPVFLVADDNGWIIGPYHAGCAERLKIDASKRHPAGMINKPVRFGTWPTAREETLPE